MQFINCHLDEKKSILLRARIEISRTFERGKSFSRSSFDSGFTEVRRFSNSCCGCHGEAEFWNLLKFNFLELLNKILISTVVSLRLSDREIYVKIH